VDARQERKLTECEDGRRDLWKAMALHGIQPPEKPNRGNG
jgi:hypothetical protein